MNSIAVCIYVRVFQALVGLAGYRAVMDTATLSDFRFNTCYLRKGCSYSVKVGTIVIASDHEPIPVLDVFRSVAYCW